VDVHDRIAGANAALTAAERRVAEVVLANPQLVAFGTVADLADHAHAGAATVVRLAAKLGFDGFTTLQASVQHDLARQLRPAAERIREPSNADPLQQQLQMELANVQATFDGVDPSAYAEVADHLANPTARLFVLSGDASRGVASQFVGDLAALRNDVMLVDGNDVAVQRTVALMRPTDVLVTLDLRRYDRWVVDAATTAVAHGVWSVAIVDSVLSPLAAVAKRTLSVAAAGAGPFDSHVGTLALLNALVTAVADRLRVVAAQRLADIETAWTSAGSLTDE
jgi:DNA-binding MurR/RpiR family transcriptional regulator